MTGAETQRLGIIGAGAIARAVAERVAAGAVPWLELLGVYARSGSGDLPGRRLAVDELTAASVVVEAAGRDAVAEYGEALLAAGTSLVCCSVAALADPALRGRLLAAASAGRSRLIVPSGAVGGLDVLGAAMEAGLDEVLVEQRKPPRTLLPEAEAPITDEPRVVFEGSVAEVVDLYPKTTNVAAAVALAGLGFDATVARVVADPALSANEVTVTARGAFGNFTLRLSNVASPNPQTSSIVAHSVVVTLRRLYDPLVVPG